MSKQPKTVNHLGIVQDINPNGIVVSILSQSACAACHAKGACGMSDTAEKIIEVPTQSKAFSIGEHVKVLLKESLGFKALTLGYVLPFLLVLLTLIVLTSTGISEAKAGLASLAVLIPYYLGLYLFRDKVSKQFTFEIESIK